MLTGKAFGLLGLRPDASVDEVDRAFRRLAKECHPDLHPDDPTAAERFVALEAAHAEAVEAAAGRAERPGQWWHDPTTWATGGTGAHGAHGANGGNGGNGGHRAAAPPPTAPTPTAPTSAASRRARRALYWVIAGVLAVVAVCTWYATYSPADRAPNGTIAVDVADPVRGQVVSESGEVIAVDPSVTRGTSAGDRIEVFARGRAHTGERYDWRRFRQPSWGERFWFLFRSLSWLILVTGARYLRYQVLYERDRGRRWWW